MDDLRVTVYDGKYTVIFDEKGLRALRWGEEWRDCCGDGMILTLAQEVDKLRKLSCILYTQGYGRGHNDTVEGDYVHIYPQDEDDYFSEEVEQIIEEL